MFELEISLVAQNKIGKSSLEGGAGLNECEAWAYGVRYWTRVKTEGRASMRDYAAEQRT